MPAKTLNLPEPSDQPTVVRAEIRGSIYTFTELPIGVYDDLVKKATMEKTDEESGVKYEETDNALLMRLMIPKVMSPAPPKSLLDTGTRMYRAIAKIINELHYGDEPVKILSSTDESEKETPEGNA